MKRFLLSTILALTLVLVAAIPAMADSSTGITVTATPQYISFSSTPITWLINGITGSGVITENITYYANPLGDTLPPAATVNDTACQFTWANASSCNLTITVNMGAFAGGGADMTNSNLGTNGAATYGAYSWYSGLAYANKVIIKSSGSSTLYTTTSAGEDKKWGCEIKTRTNAWSSATPSTATMTIAAAAVP